MLSFWVMIVCTCLHNPRSSGTDQVWHSLSNKENWKLPLKVLEIKAHQYSCKKKTQAQRKIEIFFFAISGRESVIRKAVAKWAAAGQGFKITKWPAVWYFSQILRNQRNPSSSNYHMSINNGQTIQKSCIGHNSNTWFMLGAESKTVVCDT